MTRRTAGTRQEQEDLNERIPAYEMRQFMSDVKIRFDNIDGRLDNIENDMTSVKADIDEIKMDIREIKNKLPVG